jgi:hypothetical protein
MHTGINIKARTANPASVIALLTVGLNNIIQFAVNADFTQYAPGKSSVFQMILGDPHAAFDILDEVSEYYNKYIADSIKAQVAMIEDPSIGQVHDVIFALRIENGSIKGLDMDITLRLTEVPIVPVFVKLFFSSSNENVAEMIDSLFDKMFANYPDVDPAPHRVTMTNRLGCTKVRVFFCEETYTASCTPS